MSPYNYAANNPISLFDPDGRDFTDKVAGFTSALIDNASGGLINLTDKYEPKSRRDFYDGQDAGDVASLLIATNEINTGGTGLAGCVTVTAVTCGASSEVTLPAGGVFALMLAHSSIMEARAISNIKGENRKSRPVDAEEVKANITQIKGAVKKQEKGSV